MQVRGTATINDISVDVDDDELLRLLINNDIPLDITLRAYRNNIIRNLFNINVSNSEEVFIKDEFFCLNEERRGGSHSWFESIKLREATDFECQVMDSLELLKNIEVTHKLGK